MSSPPSGPEVVISAAADLHGELPEIPPCDVLLLAGDLVPYDVERDDELTRAWFATTFARWLAATPAVEVIAVAGNHDFWALDLPAGRHVGLFDADWTYLRDAETTTRSGLRIYGSPWTRQAYDSAFEASGPELARIWSAIPAGLDVLVAHSPPRGHGDQIGEDGEVELMGATELMLAIERARPRLVVFGHAHEGYGYRATLPEGPLLANVSVRTDYTGGLHGPSTFGLRSR